MFSRMVEVTELLVPTSEERKLYTRILVERFSLPEMNTRMRNVIERSANIIVVEGIFNREPRQNFLGRK